MRPLAFLAALFRGVIAAVDGSCALLVLAAFCPLLAEAAPIELSFVARVSLVDGDIATSGWPAPISVGDELRCLLTFPSAETLRDVLRGQAGGRGWLDIGFRGLQAQHQLNWGSLTPAFFDLNNPTQLGDSAIALWYFSPTDVHPGWGGVKAGVPWDAHFQLAGDLATPISAGGELDLNLWNLLLRSRRLMLRIGYPNTTNVVAEIGTVSAVPEPSGPIVAMLVCLSGLAAARIR